MNDEKYDEHMKVCKWKQNERYGFRITVHNKNGNETSYYGTKIVSLPKTNSLGRYYNKIALYFTECKYCEKFWIDKGVYDINPVILEGKLLNIHLVEIGEVTKE